MLLCCSVGWGEETLYIQDEAIHKIDYKTYKAIPTNKVSMQDIIWLFSTKVFIYIQKSDIEDFEKHNFVVEAS
jgi:hypothetical protein